METTSPSVFTDRLTDLSTRLCASLVAVLEESIGTASPRPSALVAKLGLDKTLASRIMRGLGADDPLRAIQGLPATNGLSLAIEAAKPLLAQPATYATAVACVAEFQSLLDELPGGRGDLEAVLVGCLPDLRERSERDARRQVFRGMCTLSGLRGQSTYFAQFTYPSSEAGRLDTAWIYVRKGVRRLRPGQPVVVAGLFPPVEEEGDKSAPRTTLSGEVVGRDPSKLVIPSMTNVPASAVTECFEDDFISLTIPGHLPSVDEVYDIAIGSRRVSNNPATASDAQSYFWSDLSVRHPIESLVIDSFIHKDIQLPEDPKLTVSVSDFTRFHLDATPDTPGRDVTEEPRPVPKLSGGLKGTSTPAVEGCPEIVEFAMKQAGIDFDDFTGYRYSQPYPLPGERATIWCHLPKG